MKPLIITIEDEIFDRLQRLMTHKGERSHLLRMAVKRLVKELEETRYGKSGTGVGTKAQ